MKQHGSEAIMKRCQKIPRPGTGGDWYRRWHRLRCAECRAAWRADRKLARGLQALRQPPVPPGLRAGLLERLGLPAAEAEKMSSADRGREVSPVARRPWDQGPTRRRVLSLIRYPMVAAGAAALLVAFGLIPRWADHDGPAPPRGGEIARRLAAGQAPPGQLSGESRGIPLPAGPVATLSPVIRVPRLPNVAGRTSEHDPSPPLVPPAHQPVIASRPTGDDLHTMNGDAVEDARWWAPVRWGDWGALEERVRRVVRVRDDFVQVPFPRVVAASERQIAEAVESYKREAAVVDPRLSREVPLQVKATALSDLCEQLRGGTGIQMAAGQSVADEKVTIFCAKLPLRDVMRQLSRPFGYTWLRSSKSGEYQYELVQDLRSQLLEEELRNRDRNEALLALDREIGRYRPYLGLTPDEALAQSKTAAPVEKKLLEKLASAGWGPIQMYSRLSAQDLAAMRAGQKLSFAQEYQPGYRLLPPDVARGILQTFRSWHLIKGKEGWGLSFDTTKPGATPVPQVPDARASLSLTIKQSELGRMALNGGVFWYTVGSNGLDNGGGGTSDNYVDAVSPTVAQPDNVLANAKLAQEPALRPRISVRPRPSCFLIPYTSNPYVTVGTTPEPRVTTADVLEVVHQATGLPIVSDYYTRLYKPEAISLQNQPLFDALNRLADAMRMRWRWDGTWFQLRSSSYYDDRIKEVPNRLLSRCTASRRQHGVLTIDDLCEIAQLPDAQLDAVDMAEGARACFGLQEWELGRSGDLRKHLRFLAGFTPAQRQEALGPVGLLFTRMPLAQQQQFIALALETQGNPLQSLEELEGATLRVEYTQPGWFQWGAASHPGHGYPTRWMVPLEPGPRGQRAVRPLVVGRTRDDVLQGVRRIDPKLREALLQAMRREDPRREVSPSPVEEEIFPTRLELSFLYVPGATSVRPVHLQTSFASYNMGTVWEAASGP